MNISATLSASIEALIQRVNVLIAAFYGLDDDGLTYPATEPPPPELKCRLFARVAGLHEPCAKTKQHLDVPLAGY